MYLQKNCKKCKETASYQLTKDRDEQNDAINGQLKKIKAQLVLFDVLCKAYSDITTNEKILKFDWRNIICNKLQQFTISIAQYVSSVIQNICSYFTTP